MGAAQVGGLVDAFATASYFCAWSRLGMGRIVDAQADIEQAVQARQVGWRRYLVASLSLKTTLLVWRAELDAAQESLALAHEFDEGGGFEVPWRLHAAGRLAMARADPASALKLFTDAGDWLIDKLEVDYTVLPWRADAAHAALAIGEVERARELIEYDFGLAQRSSAPGHLGRVLRVQGLIEGGDHGIELLRQACAHFDAGGDAGMHVLWVDSRIHI